MMISLSSCYQWQWPFIGVSPDGVIYCSCHGKRALEVELVVQAMICLQLELIQHKGLQEVELVVDDTSSAGKHFAIVMALRKEI